MTLAAGMAAAGMHPVIALYSTFAQRAYDQLIHDVCLHAVTLCLDRAGLVGEDDDASRRLRPLVPAPDAQHVRHGAKD